MMVLLLLIEGGWWCVGVKGFGGGGMIGVGSNGM